MDIIGSLQIGEVDLDNWYDNKHMLKRQFSVQATTETETLFLSINNLYQMQLEFSDSFCNLFYKMAVNRLRKAWMAKLKAMKECKEQYEVIKAGVEALVQGQINSAIQHEEINKRIKLTVLKFADLDDASCES
jgi:hypothetical protein